MDERYRSSKLLVKRLVERSVAEELLRKMEDYAKIYWAGLQWGALEHNIGKQEFSLPNNYVLVTKSQLKSLEFRKPVNEVDHIHIESIVVRGQEDVIGQPAVS